MHGADAGAPPGNGNRLAHGARADPANLINHLDDADREWIEDLAESYRELAGLEETDPRAERLKMACVMCYQEWAARAEAIENNLTSRSTVGTDKDGRPVVRVEEHYLMGAASSLHRDVRGTLDKLGLLDPDDADSGRTVVEIFAQAREREGIESVPPEGLEQSEQTEAEVDT